MQLIQSKMPSHIGIIMDGNGRWASRRGMPRVLGHREGMKAVERTVDALLKLGIKTVTFFAFSTENWKRSEEEKNGIFSLVRDYLKNGCEDFIKKGVQVRSMGELDKFPSDLVAELEKVKKVTSKNEKLILNLALNYGGRDDIVYSVNKLIKSGKKEINEKDILLNLRTGDLPEPDLIIRTSGEMRISNFMIYQSAYSEFYFTKNFWPDFNEKELKKALYSYQKRERRYGGIK